MTVLADKLTYLVNPVLLELGHTRLSTLATASSNKVESLCALTLDGIIDEVLKSEPWVCVSKRDSSLTASSSTSDEFDYVYTLPTDYVRMIGEPLYQGSPKHYSDSPVVDWRTVGRLLECGIAGPDLLYVYKPAATLLEDDDTDDYFGTDMDWSLRSVIQAMCRWRWAYNVTGDMKVRAAFEAEFYRVRKMAQGENLIQMKRLQSTPENRLRFAKLLGVR